MTRTLVALLLGGISLTTYAQSTDRQMFGEWRVDCRDKAGVKSCLILLPPAHLMVAIKDGAVQMVVVGTSHAPASQVTLRLDDEPPLSTKPPGFTGSDASAIVERLPKAQRVFTRHSPGARRDVDGQGSPNGFSEALQFAIATSKPAGARMIGSAPPPPREPKPSSSFNVEFLPASAERHPPTSTEDVKRYRNVVRYKGEPDSIRSDEKPTRPYVRVGELRFGLDWYYSSNIRELINLHVPRVGGDAVLVYYAYPGGAAAQMKNAETGQMIDVFYQSVVLEVIRYTDK